MQNWRERISVNPAVCHDRACVRGTRVLVSVIVDTVAAGVPRDEILRNYAALTDPDIDAALACAAELTREGTVDYRWKSKLEVQSRRESSNRIRVDPFVGQMSKRIQSPTRNSRVPAIRCSPSVAGRKIAC